MEANGVSPQELVVCPEQVDIYALRQQEKLLMFPRYLAEIPNNSHNQI